MNTINMVNSRVSQAVSLPPEVCPTCGAKVSRQEYERILRISEAREGRLAAEQAALKRAQRELSEQRDKIAEAAAAEESSKWEAEAQRFHHRATKDAERVQLAHERAIRSEVERREAQVKRAAAEIEKVNERMRNQVAKVTQRANAALAQGMGELKREAEEACAKEIESLRHELKNVESRRRREEQTLKETIAVLQRKADARVPAHLGADGEADLIGELREQFPGDRFEPLRRGGDVLHTVRDGEHLAGKIIYEVKNTKCWQRQYLRQTQAAMESNATIYGVLVTRALPAGRVGMCILGGVIVVVPAVAVAVASVLRDGIVAIARLSDRDKASKRHALVAYLLSDQFTGAIKRIALKVDGLREALSP